MASGSVAKRPKFLSKNIKRAEKYFEVIEKSGAEFLTDILKKGSKRFTLVGNTDKGTLLHGTALLNSINMFNFRYEDGFKINNKYFPAISKILYLSTETISRPPQSHETVPLR
jgi:hypothetical protein